MQLIQQTKAIAESCCVLWTQMFSSWQCRLFCALKTPKSGSRSALANTRGTFLHMTSPKNLVTKRHVLPMFHAFTGCDTVSSFAGRGKKTAFDIWTFFDEITPVFFTLLTNPSAFNDDCMSVLEAYVVLLYDRTCTETTVNSARKHMFTTKDRSMDNIPPTRAALLQHTKRAIYKGGYVWGQALVRSPVIPSPDTFGWQNSMTQGWQPFLTLLPEAVASCSELLKCGCKKGCR